MIVGKLYTVIYPGGFGPTFFPWRSLEEDESYESIGDPIKLQSNALVMLAEYVPLKDGARARFLIEDGMAVYLRLCGLTQEDTALYLDRHFTLVAPE